MDREILFRGKRADNGEWIKGYLYITQNSEYEISSYCKYYDCERYTYIVIPETVGQYTGLTDKNGTKIFEGDIVNFRTGYYQFKNLIISFDEQTARFVCENKKCGKMPLDSKWSYEVIGNIHDNPELLEVSE